MTHATKAIYRWLLSDYIKVRSVCDHARNFALPSLVICSNIATDQMLYTEKDLEKSMDKIETVNFHQVIPRIWSSYSDSNLLHRK